MVPRLLAEPENRNGTLEPWNHYCCWVAGWVNEHLWCRWNFSPSHWFKTPILDYPDWILIHVIPYPSIAINPVSPRVAGKGCSSWNPYICGFPPWQNHWFLWVFPLKSIQQVVHPPWSGLPLLRLYGLGELLLTSSARCLQYPGREGLAALLSFWVVMQICPLNFDEIWQACFFFEWVGAILSYWLAGDTNEYTVPFLLMGLPLWRYGPWVKLWPWKNRDFHATKMTYIFGFIYDLTRTRSSPPPFISS